MQRGVGERWRTRAALRRLAGATLCLCAAACGAAPADEVLLRTGSEPAVAAAFDPAADPEPEPPPAASAPGRAREGLLPAPDAPALLWRAGRATLPGLSAAQVARRRGETDQAVGQLRGLLEGERGGRWRRWIAGLLDADDGAGWLPAARAVGRLELRELAAPLAPALAAGTPPERRLAARSALHLLFGTWLDSPEAAAPFLASATAAGTPLYARRLLDLEARSNERLFALVELEPARAVELLAADDPLVRVRAAERLGRALARGEAKDALEPRAALARLLEALEAEADPRPFHALLEAILLPQGGLASDAELERLFALFEARAAAGWDERSLSVAQALSRLVYAGSARGEQAWLTGAFSLCERLLDEALEADRRRGFEDPDAAAAAIGALASLAARARDALASEALDGTGARRTLLAVLRDPGRAAATRQAAGAALGPFLRADDVALLDEEATRDDLPAGLVHVLLGTLRDLLAQVAGGAQAAPARAAALTALEHAAIRLGSSDPDLRRSALALLADERLAPLVGGLDPAYLLRRLESEEQPDLRRGLIALVGRFGSEAMLDPLLALASFDRLAAAEGASSTELDAALEALAGGRAERVLAVARRLAANEQAAETSRLRRALALVARLAPDAARALPRTDEDAVLGWAWRLHELGVPLRGAVGGGGVLREVLERPAPAELAAGASLAEARRTHLLAVLRAETRPAEARPAEAQAILDGFASARAQFEQAGATAAAQRARRDRARLLLDLGREREALAEYRALLRDAPAVLEVGDFERLASLMGDAEGGAVERARVVADVLFCLVERDTWLQGGPAARLKDLGALCKAVLQAEDPQRLERFVALVDLPVRAASSAPADTGGATPTDDLSLPPALRGFAQEPGALDTLGTLRAGVLDALARANGTLPR